MKILVINLINQEALNKLEIVKDNNILYLYLNNKNLQAQLSSKNNINIIDLNLIDGFCIQNTINKIQPDIIYYFSNELLEEKSFEFPTYVAKEVALSITYILEIVKDKNITFFNIIKLDKRALQKPKNIYETSLLYGFALVNIYKDVYKSKCKNIFYQDFINKNNATCN